MSFAKSMKEHLNQANSSSREEHEDKVVTFVELPPLLQLF